MVIFSIIILVIVAILLMAVVLLQSSKGTWLSGSFGGSGVATSFGVRRTSDFLTKSTMILAAIFLLGSLFLNMYINQRGAGNTESIIQRNAGTQQLPPMQQQQAPPPTQTPGTQENAPTNPVPVETPAK